MPVSDPYYDDDVPCGYCGFGQDPQVRSSGGEFVPRTQDVPGGASHSITGLNIDSEELDAGGCAFCNSPEWLRGGRISWGKFRPGRRDRSR